MEQVKNCMQPEIHVVASARPGPSYYSRAELEPIKYHEKRTRALLSRSSGSLADRDLPPPPPSELGGLPSDRESQIEFSQR